MGELAAQRKMDSSPITGQGPTVSQQDLCKYKFVVTEVDLLHRQAGSFGTQKATLSNDRFAPVTVQCSVTCHSILGRPRMKLWIAAQKKLP